MLVFSVVRGPASQTNSGTKRLIILGFVRRPIPHKLLEAIEKRNKEAYHTEGDIRAYKDALKALYYLISIEKSK